jgi:hypothetical protein
LSGTAREAADRNAQALVAGNMMQLMMDITPEAMAGLMQMGAAAGVNPGAFSLTSMPAITGYELGESAVLDGGAELIPATFHSALGSMTIVATWKEIAGAWKIAAVTVNNIAPKTGA